MRAAAVHEANPYTEAETFHADVKDTGIHSCVPISGDNTNLHSA